MHGSVRKWGNGAGVMIPAAVLQAARVRVDEPVDVREEDGRIIIEPLRPPRYDIDALVAAITEENRHDPLDTGEAVGKELR